MTDWISVIIIVAFIFVSHSTWLHFHLFLPLTWTKERERETPREGKNVRSNERNKLLLIIRLLALNSFAYNCSRLTLLIYLPRCSLSFSLFLEKMWIFWQYFSAINYVIISGARLWKCVGGWVFVGVVMPQIPCKINNSNLKVNFKWI